MSDSEISQGDPRIASNLLQHFYIAHNYDPGSLQWALVSAYHLRHPQAGHLQQFVQEEARSRQVLVEVAAETLFGKSWREEPTHITENLVLGTRYSGCASPENLGAAKEEIRRRQALDPDFERRRKNAEHRAQERNEPVRSNDLALVMAQHWTNPEWPLWMGGVDGGAAIAGAMLKNNVQPANFKTTRDRLGLHSFPKRPFSVNRWKNFELKPPRLSTEAVGLIRELEKRIDKDFSWLITRSSTE